MKERPILFSAPMVRALLDGSKTQTRRVCKVQPTRERHFTGDGMAIVKKNCATSIYSPLVQLLCPYGQPGDRLWVRESYRLRRESLNGAPMDSVAPSMFCDSTRHFEADGNAPSWAGKLRPSIHMPRWASRILLEVVSVRVERLQDISEEDAKAEGIEPHEVRQFAIFGLSKAERAAVYRDAAVGPYQGLWEQINGAGSWDANPWVWVVEFKRVKP